MSLVNLESDLTPHTTLWLVLYMAAYPAVQARVQEKIDSVVKSCALLRCFRFPCRTTRYKTPRRCFIENVMVMVDMLRILVTGKWRRLWKVVDIVLHGVKILKAIQQIRKEGLTRLYRGLLPSLLQKTTSMSLMFGLYYDFQRQIYHYNLFTPMFVVKLSATMLTGSVEALLSDL
ncbi:LOW QUALITY PROTEIN: S2551-like protein [Mya arenaria]|uniref:S2551-like protein n=1 Tax=Mya arenaria TaxID=6604 RepID=A0ABY7DQ91_MYAAR|nr:LOW QUALITY PROTEIN: S2551-like protein [Mya arenaria]